MTIQRTRPFGQKYAFVVAGVIFLALLAAAGVRAAPGVLILPLGKAFGWSRDTISLSAALGIFLYGMVGPFAAALMQAVGVRRTLIGALVLMAVSISASAWMTQPWHLMVTWGLFSGIGSGCVAIVLGATVVNRWFVTHRGLIMGLLTASTATGTLAFLPALAAIAEHGGWRPVVWTVAAGCALLIPLAWWLLPERPSDIGLRPYGATEDEVDTAPRRNLLSIALGTLAAASKQRTFWFLFATFFICGFTTNGLIGTHFIAMCGDHGIPEVRAAGLLAMMGAFDLVGTTLSGWLTDRYDPRKLLFVYYGLRGLSLIWLPYSDFSFASLSLFGMFYGLDWIATVPPTLRLATEAFGDRDAPVVFGWVAAGHQVGAASAAFFAGALRTQSGNYLQPFVVAGITGLIAAGLALMINRRARLQPALQAG
ncbi:Predicted arabinose efflux permease, MFS family [Dyella jiangningensis]|uniref:MFS transporter n=1 Tax=Dyella sp. AtDHG13 TaxID=1938897 RepID=UPI0008873959|nr:MFS transporter [Dyella sp. AtDHG13]PXV60611.1 putative MFS family arabinose efflux permease [Dyella sp. AtDHG13]SDJ52288.1 Predicted arabinose efflux permease, MFS family [Dyella jiangningensis]